jgi:hypothetical protein
LLLISGKDGKLSYGAFKQIADIFGVDRQTVSNIWRRGRKSLEDGCVAAYVQHRLAGTEK